MVGDIATELGDARAIMEPIARMKLQSAVHEQEGKFAEVVREELELDNLTF